MARLKLFILVFAVLFTVLIVGLPFLSSQFGPYPLMKVQDVVDLFTPLILIPLYWMLFRPDADRRPPTGEMLGFVVLAALWVEGQGMHLAANSIGHHTETLAGTDAAQLTFFYDEILSHYMWHAGIIGLALLLIYRQWRNPFLEGRSGPGIEIGGGILHGLSYALMILEGATTLLGVPAAAIVVLFGFIQGRGRMRQQPVLAFFFVAFLTALIVFMGWRLYWGCFVEPFDVLRLHFNKPVC